MGSNSAASLPFLFLLRLAFYSVCCPVYFKSSLNRDDTVAEKDAAKKTGPSQVELELTDCHFQTLCESSSKARTAHQIVPLLSVAKKHSIDQPIKTESTESVADWANRTGAIGFLPILNTEAWEDIKIGTY